MKKISVIFLLAASSCIANAQNNKVSSANIHLKDFIDHGDSAELFDAKSAIDEAALNEKTKDEPKMYLYRGEIYLMIFQMRLSGMAAKTKLSQAYAAMDTATISIAATSFEKVLQLAPTDFYSEEAKQKQNMPACLAQLENKALMEYNNQRYASSLALYEKAMDMDNLLEIKDSTHTENILNAAVAADKAGNTAKAQKFYLQLINMKAGGATPYEGMVNMYLKQKDTANTLDYLQKGRAAYPDDIKLIIIETNIYLARNNSDKAEANLTLTINKVEQLPEKERSKELLSSLYSTLGNIYDKKANPKDAKGGDAPKTSDYEELFTKAETNYQKALAITPDNFDLLFVTGALYYNRGVVISKEANNIPLSEQDKYNKLLEDAKGWFLKAQPFFEKAHTVNPKDQNNIHALLQVYGSTGQEDKAKALQGQ